MRDTSAHWTTNITWIPIKCTTDEEIQQAIKDDCLLVGHENGTWYFKKPP